MNKKIILILSAMCLMAVPMFAAEVGSYGAFRFNGAKKQAYSFTQRAFSVTDNLWNRDAKNAADTIGESADQVELFIGRIGESGDTKNQRRREAGQTTAINKAKNLKYTGIALTAVGATVFLPTFINMIVWTSIYSYFFIIIGLPCLLAGVIPGLIMGGAGAGCLAYSIKLGA